MNETDTDTDTHTVGATDLPRLRALREALVEETEVPFDLGVGTSPYSDAASLELRLGRGGPGAPASWITMMSSLLCWPRCSLAKSKPFTLGAWSWQGGG